MAIYYGRRNTRGKQLVYEVLETVPLVKAVSPSKDYKLSVAFKRKGQKEEKLKSIYVRFLRFANLGKESIRREDIAPANPLKLTRKCTNIGHCYCRNKSRSQ